MRAIRTFPAARTKAVRVPLFDPPLFDPNSVEETTVRVRRVNRDAPCVRSGPSWTRIVQERR